MVEAIADLAEAVRGLTEVVRTANRMNKPPDWPDDDTCRRSTRLVVAQQQLQPPRRPPRPDLIHPVALGVRLR